jgi:hypothetical protein
MNKLRLRLFLCLLLWLPGASWASPPAGCEGEGGLAARNDIIFCEEWESSTWYLTSGYYDDGEKTSPTAAGSGDVVNTSLVESGCISGKCLRVRCRAANDADSSNRGCSGMLSIWRAISGTQQSAYFRYYIWLSPNWSPLNYGNCAPPCTPVAGDNGGKWPGFADVRTNADAYGQCGNGGAGSNDNLPGDAWADGINCWSARLKYRNCLGSGSADICSAEGGSSEKTRIGWYWYIPPYDADNNQAFGSWDNQSWGTDMPGSGGTCASDRINIGSTGTDGTSCGKGAAGIKNGKWYRLEGYIAMNTPGSDDGIARAWVNGTLKYEKTNMRFREVGHDDLHVRGFWLDIHMGGEAVGPFYESYILLDQLVVASGARVEGWSAD